MAKALTAPAVARLKPKEGKRREVPDGGCPGLHLVLQETGARSWAVRYRRPDGRPAKLTLGTVDVTGKETNGEPVIGGHHTLAAARRLAAEVRRQIALDNDPAAAWKAEKLRRRTVAVEKASSTFAACAVAYLSEHRVRRTNRKPRDFEERARLLGLDFPKDGGDPVEIKGGLAQRWHDKPISDIDGHDIYTLLDEAKRRGVPGLERRNDGLSDSRARKLSDALGGMFKWLLQHRRQQIAVNPCIGVWRPPPPVARERVLNCKPDVRRADEARWFWTSCDSVSEPFGPLLKLLLLTGCRLSEIAEMRWAELSDDLSILRLPGERTKNGRPHNVPLPPLARDLLRKVNHIENCEFVFSTTGTTPVSGFSKIKAQLDAAMLVEAQKERGKSGVVEPWRLHDLRRSCATGMAGIGIPPHIIEAVLNHVSGAKVSVAGVYNREQYEPEKKAALERWAEHIERIVTGSKMAKVVPLRGRS